MIPYRIETLYQHDPWANWAVFGTTIATSLAILYGVIPKEVSDHYFVLGEGSPFALIGYLFAHGGLVHLAGNMLFLWIFGNAVCATVGNFAYLLAYFGLGSFAGLLHVLVSGEPVIGASGAITGLVGMAVAFYPTNRVSLVFIGGFFIRFFRTWLWGVALYWTTWDILGAWLGLGNVAYWAHLGGTAAGLGLGLLLLATKRVQLTEFDRGSLLDSLMGRKPAHREHMSAEVTAAQLREAARAFRASLAVDSAEAAEVAGVVAAARAATHTPKPAQAQGKKRLRLRLGMKPAAGDADTPAAPPSSPAAPPSSPATPPVSPAAPTGLPAGATASAPLPPPPAPPGTAGARKPSSAWPASLPEGRYFYFDGQDRLGPIARTEFLARVSFAPDTSRWWFWVAGMEEWKRVSDLTGYNNSGPAAVRPAAPSRQQQRPDER